MGFSANLKTNAVNEWKDFYLNYDKLYTKLKHKTFKSMIREELEKVNNFYFLLEKKAVDEKDNIFSDVLSEIPAEDLKRFLKGVEDIDAFRIPRCRKKKSKRADSNEVALTDNESHSKGYKRLHEASSIANDPALSENEAHSKGYKKLHEAPGIANDPALSENEAHSKGYKSAEDKKLHEAPGIANDPALSENEAQFKHKIKSGFDYSNYEDKKTFKTQMNQNIRSQGNNENAFERRRKEKNLTEFLSSLTKITSFREMNANGMLKLAKKYTDMRRNSKFYDRFAAKLKDSYFYKSRRIEAIKSAVKHLYRQIFARNEPEKAKTIFRLIRQGSKSSDWQFIISGALIGIGYTLSIMNRHLRANGSYWAIANIYLGFILFGFCLKLFKEIKVNYKFIYNFDVCSSMNNSLYLLLVSTMFLVNVFLFIFASKFKLNLGIPIVLVQMAVLFIPLDILFYNSRIYLLGAFARAIFQPFSTIRFRHFYFIDIAQSFSFSLENLLKLCRVNNQYILFFSTTIWTLIRIFQCLKRYSSSKLAFPHIFNSAKFSIAILFKVMKILKDSNSQLVGFYIFIGLINSTFGLLWDLFIDWIIKRDEYMYPVVCYPVFIAFNVFARFLWLINLLGVKHPILESNIEVIRRFMWTLIRVEVEHLNNCDHLKTKNAINLTAGELFYKKNQTKIEDNQERNPEEDQSSNTRNGYETSTDNTNHSTENLRLADAKPSIFDESMNNSFVDESISGYNSEADSKYSKFYDETSCETEDGTNMRNERYDAFKDDYENLSETEDGTNMRNEGYDAFKDDYENLSEYEGDYESFRESRASRQDENLSEYDYSENQNGEDRYSGADDLEDNAYSDNSGGDEEYSKRDDFNENDSRPNKSNRNRKGGDGTHGKKIYSYSDDESKSKSK